LNLYSHSLLSYINLTGIAKDGVFFLILFCSLNVVLFFVESDAMSTEFKQKLNVFFQVLRLLYLRCDAVTFFVTDFSRTFQCVLFD